MTSVHLSGAVGPEIPLSPGMGGATQVPHWAAGGLAGGQQTIIRYMICKHLVSF